MDVPKIMPDEVATVFDELFQHMCQLHMHWLIYRQLFGTAESNVELLNLTVPTCASVIQQVLQDAVYLGFTRMTDPSEMRGNPNLTFRRLAEVARKHVSTTLSDELGVKIAIAEVKCKTFRGHRNKRVAHSDLALALQDTFTRPSRAEVEDMMSACRTVMNVLHIHFRNGPMAYEMLEVRGGGDALISYLEGGVRLQKLRRQLLLGELSKESLAKEISRI